MLIVRFSSLQPKVSLHSIQGLSKPYEKPSFIAFSPSDMSFFQLIFYKYSFLSKLQLSKSLSIGQDIVIGFYALSQLLNPSIYLN